MRPSSTKSLSLSIIIATKDRLDHLRDCIESILKQTVLPDEVIVVDGSTESDLRVSIEQLFKSTSEVMLKYLKADPWLTAQNNLGARESKGDLLTFLDDDTVLDEQYVENVKQFFFEHHEENVGALSCKILDPAVQAGTSNSRVSLSHILTKVFLLQSTGNGNFRPSGLPALIDQNCNEVKKVEFVYGGNATYPRRVFEEFKFDEMLPTGFNLSDDDIAYRVSRKYQNYWTPKAFLYHKSHYVNNDRYFKSKSFIICHFYLRMKNYPKDLKHTGAFYWSVVGRISLEALISLKTRNFTGLRGTFSGLGAVWFQGAHRPRGNERTQ